MARSRAPRGCGGSGMSRRTAADHDQRQPLKQSEVIVLLALKLRTATKHTSPLAHDMPAPARGASRFLQPARPGVSKPCNERRSLAAGAAEPNPSPVSARLRFLRVPVRRFSHGANKASPAGVFVCDLYVYSVPSPPMGPSGERVRVRGPPCAYRAVGAETIFPCSGAATTISFRVHARPLTPTLSPAGARESSTGLNRYV